MRENLKRLLLTIGRWFGKQFSVNDCVFFAGAGLLGYGVWLIYPPWAFITLGVLFIVLTTYGRFKT